VVIFSHGLAGNRVLYSVICSELASQGYVVLAVEHSDGTASCCKVAGGKVRSPTRHSCVCARVRVWVGSLDAVLRLPTSATCSTRWGAIGGLECHPCACC
jgi:hypothetical protein